MKQMKKLAALVLAMVMAFSCMVVPAMAAGDEGEGIMPRKPVYTCAECGGYAEMSTSERTGSMQVESCSDVHKKHYHDAIIVTKTITCEKGHTSSSETVYLGACQG